MVIEYCQCVISVINTDSSDMKQFHSLCTDNISDAALKNLLLKFGPNLGLLLQWIDAHHAEIRENSTCPFQTKIINTVLVSHESAWTDFLKGKKNSNTQKLNELKESCETIISEHNTLLKDYKDMQQKIDEDYSSYSDYSQSDTTSDEEEDDEAEEDEGEGEEVELEKQPRRYFRRRR